MGRYHGRNGRVYLGIASDTAVAEPVPYLASWSINFTVEKIDVSAMGDSNKVYVAGLADASGNFDGFHDDSTAQTYTAATDGLARKFYLYPNLLSVVKYFWGTILPDFSINGGVAGAVAISSQWNAASTIAKVG
jgi:hypothetical protein